MPKLHKYVPSSKKDGFYIHAMHSGQNVTYQVTSLAERIFEQLGYRDSTELTGEMLYTLHRLRLIYTNRSGVKPPASFDELAANAENSGSDTAKGDREEFFSTIIDQGDLDQDEREDLNQYLEKQDLIPGQSPNKEPTGGGEWRPSKPDTTETYVGTVDFFNDIGGYGFIECPILDEDTFYHMEDLGGRDLKEETNVEFVRIETPDGPRAPNVRVLCGNNSPPDSHEIAEDSLADRPPLAAFQEARMYDADLDIALLGTGGDWPTKHRMTNAVMVTRDPDTFLFDVGEGTQRQMDQYGVGFAIDSIFLTSTETDHLSGLGPLLERLSTEGREDPIKIYVPNSGKEAVNSLLELYDRCAFPVEVHPIREGVVFDAETYAIEAFSTGPDGKTVGYMLNEAPRRGQFDRTTAETLGVEPGLDFTRLCKGTVVKSNSGDEVDPRSVLGDPTPGRTLVYTGDVPNGHQISISAQDVDLLIHEAASLGEHHDEDEFLAHSTAESAGQTAERLNGGQLVLTGIKPPTEPQTGKLADAANAAFDGAVHVAKDGDTIHLSVPETSPPPRMNPSANPATSGDTVGFSDFNEGMYIRLTVDRKKKDGTGLTINGSVHIQDGGEYVERQVTVQVTAVNSGYAVTTVTAPPTDSTVHRYEPSRPKKNQSTAQNNSNSRQRRVRSGSSNPFKGGSTDRSDGGKYLSELVRKKH